MTITKRAFRTSALINQLNKRILILDGATGTALQRKNLKPADFGGDKFDGCNENLTLLQPNIIRDVHKLYLDAGADIIETNTFGATPIVLAEYDLQDKCYELNFKGTQIARIIADEYSKKDPEKPRFVAGSMGPTTKSLSLTGGISFKDLSNNYYQQAKGLYDGGADYFLLETCNDTRNIKAALIGLDKFFSEQTQKIPIAISVTIEATGTMLAGQNIDAIISSLEHIELLYIGINCATGPSLMTDHIRSLSEKANTRIACVPNAGLPNEDGNYLETPKMLSDILEKFINNGWINLLGGCCGTHEGHIKKISEMVISKQPRIYKPKTFSSLSGIEVLEISDEKRPLLVGERTNSIGSKKFRRLISENKISEAAEIAKTQVKKGAHIIDVCLANPDREEFIDMECFLEELVKKIKVPIMIDSTNHKVIEMALTYSQGKAIINSINLEDGEKRFSEIVPLAKKYGAALVVGTIDDDPIQSMALTRKRKFDIAQKSYELLTSKYGISETDIYFDPLVFPCATGNENYIGSAVETIEAIKLIKEKYPNSKSVLGISNISFGLPTKGREVLNSVFLYHCVQAGLDLAIVNTQKIKRFTTIAKEEILLSENLLFNIGDDPITKFANFYRNKKDKDIEIKSDIPLDEKLKHYILDGIQTGLNEDLDKMMEFMTPLEIINGPLMNGMKEVGKFFNSNKLIIAEVLQSAEAMKKAVDHLRPHLKTTDNTAKTKILLATVKGDVHDIGKNLVDIILSNNGHEVINLGIKITSDQLIEGVKKHSPDIIGLSGLLVKSAQQMILTVNDLKEAGINIPIIIGGAALTKNFVMNKIAPAYGNGLSVYAKDAMQGLSLVNKILNNDESLTSLKLKQSNDITYKKNQSTARSSTVETIYTSPKAPDFKKHVIKDTNIEQIFKYINPHMIYNKHLGIKKEHVELIINNKFEALKNSKEGLKAYEIYHEVEKIKKQYATTHLIPSATYQFFNCDSHGNTISIYNDSKKLLEEITFPRQSKIDGLCLSDYVIKKNIGIIDNIVMFVTSVGQEIKEEVSKLKDNGNFLHSHILSAVTIECAEAYAELLHSNIREIWGFSDPKDISLKDIFHARYRGKRYSFGHPACPDLKTQKILWDLLHPDKSIGVELTESYMMDPEASLSAIVFHHKDTKYFNIRTIDR